MIYTAAVITMSDKGAAGLREDTSGPAICSELENKGFSVIHRSIIPDEPDQIKAELIRCADELSVNLVLTTGGTGFSKRDVTPEATLEIIDRHTPGIPEAMRAASMKITSRGMLSRQEAGIRNNTLVVNLPGSKKAALECLAAVADSLMHGVEMLLGTKTECASRGNILAINAAEGSVRSLPLSAGKIVCLVESHGAERPRPGLDDAINSAEILIEGLLPGDWPVGTRLRLGSALAQILPPVTGKNGVAAELLTDGIVCAGDELVVLGVDYS